MRTYQIYLIENEFANHFYGREFMFFNLFTEYEQAEGELRRILRRQINYVTKKIPAPVFTTFMNEHMHESKECFVENDVYYIRKVRGSRSSQASLGNRNQSLVLHAEGTYESETIFFEWLRRWNPYFLALDVTLERCVWLRPIKQRNFVFT